MSTWRSGEAALTSRQERHDGLPLRHPTGAGREGEGRVELRGRDGSAETTANSILLPVAVGALFLVVLVLGAIVS